MYICIDVCLYECMRACMYVYKYMYIYSYLHIWRKAFQDMHYENIDILNSTLYLNCKSASKNLENLIYLIAKLLKLLTYGNQ